MAFQITTLSDLRTSLINRLDNANFWANAELDLYLKEAFRMWNLFTGRWHGETSLSTTTTARFYSPALVTSATTDQQLLNELQYHLLETANNGASMVSDLWTVSEIVDVLNKTYETFQAKTLLTQQSTTLATNIGVHKYDLSSVDTRFSDIMRIAWIDATGTSHGLQRIDTLQANALTIDWMTSSDTPFAYSITREEPLEINIIKAPKDPGYLHIIYTTYGTELSNTGVVVAVPDDFTPYIKWGCLATLLSKEGQAHDPGRAAYCNSRFMEGCLMAKEALGNWLTWDVAHNDLPLFRTSFFSPCGS